MKHLLVEEDWKIPSDRFRVSNLDSEDQGFKVFHEVRWQNYTKAQSYIRQFQSNILNLNALIGWKKSGIFFYRIGSWFKAESQLSNILKCINLLFPSFSDGKSWLVVLKQCRLFQLKTCLQRWAGKQSTVGSKEKPLVMASIFVAADHSLTLCRPAVGVECFSRKYFQLLSLLTAYKGNVFSLVQRLLFGHYLCFKKSLIRGKIQYVYWDRWVCKIRRFELEIFTHFKMMTSSVLGLRPVSEG